jgi:predicted anti-sigma-YlaC factor YlaD
MNPSCADVRDAFLRGEEPDRAELAQHLQDCAECRELCAGEAELGRALSAASRAEPDELELSAPSLAGEVGVRATLRALPTRTRALLLAAVAVTIAVVGFALNGRDLTDTPMARLYAVVALYVAGLWLAARRGLLGAGECSYQRRTRSLALAALGLPVLVALLSASADAAFGGAASALGCFVYGALLALPILLGFLLLGREDRLPVGGLWLLAALTGVSANLVLELHCPSRHLGHLLFGHAGIGVVVLGVALAVRAGRRSST